MMPESLHEKYKSMFVSQIANLRALTLSIHSGAQRQALIQLLAREVGGMGAESPTATGRKLLEVTLSFALPWPIPPYLNV